MSTRWSEEDYAVLIARQQALRAPQAVLSRTEEQEKPFMARVIALAKTQGYLVYHTFDSRKSPEGYPDLCMVRADGILWAELKSATGKVSMAQQRWISMLLQAGQECHLWRPKDWDEIVVRLSRKTSFPRHVVAREEE